MKWELGIWSQSNTACRMRNQPSLLAPAQASNRQKTELRCGARGPTKCSRAGDGAHKLFPRAPHRMFSATVDSRQREPVAAKAFESLTSLQQQQRQLSLQRIHLGLQPPAGGAGAAGAGAGRCWRARLRVLQAAVRLGRSERDATLRLWWGVAGGPPACCRCCCGGCGGICGGCGGICGGCVVCDLSCQPNWLPMPEKSYTPLILQQDKAAAEYQKRQRRRRQAAPEVVGTNKVQLGLQWRVCVLPTSPNAPCAFACSTEAPSLRNWFLLSASHICWVDPPHKEGVVPCCACLHPQPPLLNGVLHGTRAAAVPASRLRHTAGAPGRRGKK